MSPYMIVDLDTQLDSFIEEEINIDVSGNITAELRKRKAKALDIDIKLNIDVTSKSNFIIVYQKGRGRPSMYVLLIIASLDT